MRSKHMDAILFDEVPKLAYLTTRLQAGSHWSWNLSTSYAATKKDQLLFKHIEQETDIAL